MLDGYVTLQRFLLFDVRRHHFVELLFEKKSKISQLVLKPMRNVRCRGSEHVFLREISCAGCIVANFTVTDTKAKDEWVFYCRLSLHVRGLEILIAWI